MVGCSNACYIFSGTLEQFYSVALMLQCCVCRRLSVTLCIVAKRCVVEQKLLLRAYRKLYMRNRLVPK